MMLLSVVGLLTFATAWGDATPTNRVVKLTDGSDDSLDSTEIQQIFVVFRHGDRTPDQEELALYPAADETNVFFPYGKKALTNKGKQRSFSVGKYLRKRYNDLLSQLYLPDDITIRTTDYARTKMTALTALAGLYPPPPAQRWNAALNWQPIPYDTPPRDDDNLLYYYNCPRYLALRSKAYGEPEVKHWLAPYEGLFGYIREHTGTNITTPEDVFYLDNLFQTLMNVGIKTPKWAEEVMPQIKEVTKIEYASEFYNSELIRLASGVLMEEIINATGSFIAGNTEQPKARLYSAHENNVAALMAAARVFTPHQPNYGSAISIELRKNTDSGKYGFVAVYAPEAGGPGKILPVTGCGGDAFCDYDKFVTLVRDFIMSDQEFKEQCSILP